jgi:hypothetical protein
MPVYSQNFDLSQIEEYLQKGATPGARNDTLFHVAMLCCSNGVLKRFAPRLIARDVDDGHTEAEAHKILKSAWDRYQRNGTRQHSVSDQSAPCASPPKVTLPPPIFDGFIVFMETLFEPDEYVALSDAHWIDGTVEP